MKKLLFISVICMFSCITYGQMSFSKNNQFELESKTLKNTPQPNMQTKQYDLPEYQIAYTRHCLQKFRREKLTGLWMQVGGVVLAGTCSALYNSNELEASTASIGYIAGGLAAITGGIMQITCHRWLKKAYLDPAKEGIGLQFVF